MEATYQHFGRIDILVNAAAGNFLAAAEDLSPNGFRTGSFFRLSLVLIMVCEELCLKVCQF